ncbi:MAG: hypothetical protein AAF378_19330 [Cyanobacteria bacterium P01_A01_bin.84]
MISLWHQTISNRDRNINLVQTRIVIADENIITSAFNQILELDTNSKQLNIQANKISILFYSTSQN